MARLITAKLHGVDKLRGVLAGALPDKRIGAALEETAKDISALARQLVHVRQGVLRRSIRARAVRGSNRLIWQVVAGSRRAFYAHFVERGTRRSRAYPFLRPAFEAYRSKIMGRISKAVRAGLRAGTRKRNR